MKKIFKILAVSVISLIAVMLISVSVALWLIFTPERLTPIIRKQAEKYITCQTVIGEIELTFFSTFPHFGIKIKDFALINPLAGAQSDSLISINEITGIVDAKAWLKNSELILIGLEMEGGSVNIYSDSLGIANFDIFTPDSDSVPESTTLESNEVTPTIDIRNITLKYVNISYTDLSMRMISEIRDLDSKISGIVNGDSITGQIIINSPSVSFEYEGEKYLQKAAVALDITADFLPSKQFVRLNKAEASVNGLEFMINGSIENDTIDKNLTTDITYKLESWQVKTIVALVPPTFRSYLDGITADGLLSSEGSIKGVLSDSVMPTLEIRLQIEKGALKYADFPLPLHDISGKVTLHTDLKTDSVSYLDIMALNAKTPSSSVNIQGRVKQLFSDIHCDLITTTLLNLGEFEGLIPDSMNVHLKGRVNGRVRSVFYLSQIEKMQVEKMKVSGSLRLSDFYADYDSIIIKTDKSDIDFSLPNLTASTKNTRFASAKVAIGNLTAFKPGSYNAFLQNAELTLETSDARDTSRIPDLICSFRMDSLSAGTDTMAISIRDPYGKVTVAPGPESPDQARIILTYNSSQLNTSMGHSSVAINKINIDTEILNDNTRKDIILQWMANGFVEMEQGTIFMDGFTLPIEIPSLKMDFGPETFNIRESKFQIGKSDFRLTGDLTNILSYYRGDSILRGDFIFRSDTTDVLQLMALTNGIGHEDSTAVEPSEKNDADTLYTGPYLVPKKIELFLTTNINTATMGIDTATNIRGSVQVNDGILVLDGLSFKTPAARMQLTAMYRTPRKNHLYLGLDYHMLDIEISELTKMIPDIDTLMPMLRSFSGQAEFHIAVETYLDSMYNVKKSTLRGASSIKGSNLILMDGETFSEISKTLNFSKKTENKVDSLSAEFTIFRDEIDVYPFLIVMDKYKAVVAGRHNFDMSFNYHISVVDCPLPIKLGIDVKGTEEALAYNLAKCRYAEFYRPASRKVVENKQIELRKLIRDALTRKVVE